VTLVRQNITYFSNGDMIAGTLFLPEGDDQSGALIFCHGAMDFKENYFEFCEVVATKGIAALAIDMHGNGQSQGKRYHVNIDEWVADIQSALDFLQDHPRIDRFRIGAFGISSGGTAVLECAIKDKRIKAIITLDATVRSLLSLPETIGIKILILAGKIKKFITNKELRISMVNEFKKVAVTADPEINEKWAQDPRILKMWSSFPIPGAVQSFMVDTLKRTHKITSPTLVLHGEKDQIDPPESARMLFDTLTCEKQIHIIPDNGHVGHLDRNKVMVINLTAEWATKYLRKNQNLSS
jgi:alpha-beta hydrolase superfamily lysophospholipase